MWQIATYMDFSEWSELGVKYNDLTTLGSGAIFKETGLPLVTYSQKADPDMKRSHASIAKFSNSFLYMTTKYLAHVDLLLLQR